MLKNKILLLFTNHRVAEKLWPIIPILHEEYIIDIFLIGLFSPDTPWVGDIDERNVYIDKYKKYINNVIEGPGIRYHGDTIKTDLSQYIDISSYQFVIYDDNRKMQEFGIPDFYHKCKQHGVFVIGNSHGNENNPHNEIGVSYDYRMDFESGGIPANDTLKNVAKNPKHILIITNFLSNRNSIFPINFDHNFVSECGVIELAKHYNLPIKVKIKTRLDKTDYENDVSYVKSLLECDVVTNTDNIDQLIADSALVISSPSTLCFKPIQLGIPTILINGSGAIGLYKTYPGLVNLNKQEIFNNIQKQVYNGTYTDYIKQTIKGGESFNSSRCYIEKLKQVLNENNI